MANLKTDTTLQQTATAQIDLAQVSVLIGQAVQQVLRQVLVIGDPVSGLNAASVVPDEPQGWEAGLVVKLGYGAQLREVSDTLLKIHAELRQININTGGVPVTDAPPII